jgi:hypothetical protein
MHKRQCRNRSRNAQQTMNDVQPRGARRRRHAIVDAAGPQLGAVKCSDLPTSGAAKRNVSATFPFRIAVSERPQAFALAIT